MLSARGLFWLCYLASVLYLAACVVDQALAPVEEPCSTDTECQARHGGTGGPES